jgi:hypothetical protein
MARALHKRWVAPVFGAIQEATLMQCCRRLIWSWLAMPLMAAGCEQGAAELQEPVGVSAQALSRPRAPSVPSELRLPAGHTLSFVADAEGVQVYACAEAANGTFAWTFERPDALLFGRWGRVIGHHYEGPTWEGLDDSFVAASDPRRYPVDGAIPWLRLTATGFGGDGLFSKVTYIHRLNTEGGLGPDSGCDADHVGARVRVPYTATYYFYAAANSGRPWYP